MTDFTMVVVGCGGGPSENDLSSYLVKCSQDKWSDGALALEAGSGLGALTRIIEDDPYLFHDGADDDKEDDEVHYAPAVASRVYSSIRSFIITHGHLDHAMSLVMAAGSHCVQPAPRIFGLESTIATLEGMFNGQVWPRLAAREDEPAPPFFYRYRTIEQARAGELEDEEGEYAPITPGISARAFPISHGPSSSSSSSTLSSSFHSHSHPPSSSSSPVYPSSAWFLRSQYTGREFLFFGDVEPDSLSLYPQTRRVWRAAAPKIRSGTLDTVFLECSWKTGRKDAELYGHLSPPHFLDELRHLASEVVLLSRPPQPVSKPVGLSSMIWRFLGYPSTNAPPPSKTLPDSELQGALRGVRVVVIHCKASFEDEDEHIVDVITGQIRSLVDAAGLGATIIGAKQGMRIHI